MEKQVNRPKIKKGNILVYLVLILGSVLMIFPFIWMISTSFKTVPETTLIPPTLLPASFSNTAAYEQVTKSLPFFNLYFNTIMMFVIGLALLLTANILNQFFTTETKNDIKDRLKTPEEYRFIKDGKYFESLSSKESLLCSSSFRITVAVKIFVVEKILYLLLFVFFSLFGAFL